MGVPRSYAEGCNTHALVLLESRVGDMCARFGLHLDRDR